MAPGARRRRAARARGVAPPLTPTATDPDRQGPARDRRPHRTLAELHDLTGKVAVVTGGSRGIGRAIAQRLAAAGADVVVASRKLDACETAAAEITASTGRRSEGIACHVGRWADCDDLVAATLERFGRLDTPLLTPVTEFLSNIEE